MENTQRQKIIDYIQRFGSITSWEAYRDLGITQFALRIKELKENGYHLKTKWESKRNKDEKMVYFKRYYFLN
ncbi:MAG: hypothetical protein HFJ33_02740 [Clostridia bacterium]|nr:hypothetical protein [Clostridia bacterium]